MTSSEQAVVGVCEKKKKESYLLGPKCENEGFNLKKLAKADVIIAVTAD